MRRLVIIAIGLAIHTGCERDDPGATSTSVPPGTPAATTQLGGATVAHAPGKPDPQVLTYQQAKAVAAQTPSGEQVVVPLNPLIWLLGAREKQKGTPLTREEVLAIRDDAKCVVMRTAQAQAFYAALDSQAPVPRIDPERCWEEWQEMRGRVERFMPS